MNTMIAGLFACCLVYGQAVPALNGSVTGNTVTVHGEYAHDGPLDTITFSDGVTWSYTQVEQMLLEGTLPAILAPNLPRSFVNGDSRIKQLFADPKAEEIAYFRETGIFPIMHVTVIKREIVDRYPWIPTNLVKAFDAAKAIAYRRAGNPRVPTLAWARDAWDEQRAILGEDPFQYGMGEANRKNLDTILRYTHEQGMIARRLPLDDLFAATDLGDAGGEEAEL